MGTQIQDGRIPDLQNKKEVQVTELMPKNNQGNLLLRPSGQLGYLISFLDMNKPANHGQLTCERTTSGPSWAEPDRTWLFPPSGLSHCGPATAPSPPYA